MVRAVTPIPFVKARFFDRCGKPLAGGKVYTYEANTTTDKTTYKDPYGLTPNTNPIILDAAGEADIYLDGTYRIRITDRNDVLVNDVAKIGSWFSDNLQDTLDNISGAMDDAIKPMLQTLDDTINTAAAAGAGANGWTADLVFDTEQALTQKQINSMLKKQRFSVKAYGAKGSTTANEVDDGNAIIAAIKACNDAGGGEVFFDPLPSGMYYASTLRSQLTNINNVKINGNKQRLCTINPEITTNGSRSPFFISTGNNIEVFGFSFDGRYDIYTSKSKRINSHNFAGENLSNVKIYHNVFSNCGYPNDTTDEAGDAIYIIRNSSNVDIFENIFINPARWSISFQYNTTDLSGISIRDNIQYITRPNKALGFVDLEFSSSSVATQVSDIKIENNTAYFACFIALSNSSFKDVSISNNTLKGYTYGATRVYKDTTYPYGFGLTIAPDTGRLPLENIKIHKNTFDTVNKQNLEITFASKGLSITDNTFKTQADADSSCGFTKGINISNATDVNISGNKIIGTANQTSVPTLSVTSSTGDVYNNIAKHSVSTSPVSFSSVDGGELRVYSNYFEAQNSTYQFNISGGGVLFWDNATPQGTSGRITNSAIVKFYGKNNTKLNADYNAQITNKFFAGMNGLNIAYANAAPTSGVWNVGDIVYNTVPSSGGVLGWSCVNATGSGTWMPFGTLGTQSVTTTNLQSATHAINTTNKFVGKIVLNSTDKKLYYATGSLTTDAWTSADAVTTVTPA